MAKKKKSQNDNSDMMKKMLLGGVAGFIFVFVYEFLVHGNLMMGMYQATESLWRPQEEANMLVMAASQLLFAFAVAFFYPIVGPDKDCKKGVPFGFGLGLVMAMPELGTYAFLPIPITLSIAWAVATFFKAFGTAFIVSKVFNR